MKYYFYTVRVSLQAETNLLDVLQYTNGTVKNGKHNENWTLTGLTYESVV